MVKYHAEVKQSINQQTASQVAIATYMQPVKLCRIILYKSRSVFLKQLTL